MVFRMLWSFGALTGAVILCFFLAGVADGSVSVFNIRLWLGTLAVVAAILGGSRALHKKGHARMGIAVVCLLAVPALLYVLFFAVILISQPRWN